MSTLSSESGADLTGGHETTKPCLKGPPAEIFEAAFYLDEAVCAHLAEKFKLAQELICRADMPDIREWTESLWGKGGPWTQRPRKVANPPPHLSEDQRPKPRMPTKAQRAAVVERDGRHCRFCGIPVIRREVREKIIAAYPSEARWKTGNINQHAGFQAMWLQYDHVLPNSRGGMTDLSNLIVTCAPCNFGRDELTLEEVGLEDPRTRDPLRSSWDGLERFR